MEGIGTVLIKIFDGMMRKLKKVRYVHQLRKNLISFGALEALSLEISGRDGVLKMLKGSMCDEGRPTNNMYYLKGTMITRQMASSIGSDDDCTQL